MACSTLTLHSSLLFDPRKKAFVKNVSIKINTGSGGITEVFERASDEEINDGDIDLRGKVVMPGFVDAHTHIFLHPYRYTCSQPNLGAARTFSIPARG
jgi:imidazolonepropionase-like amidohydrolase